MLFLKTTNTFVAPGVFQVDIAAKPPGKTFNIIAAFDANDPPQTFIDGIKGMGFKEAQSSTYTHGEGKKVLDVVYQKAGTDIFEGWTVAEKEANLKQIETMLAGFGVTVTPRVMSLAEAYQ